MKGSRLPSLPAPQPQPGGIISSDQLTRKKLQALLHLMTQDLKSRGTKTPHIFLPFRSRVDDAKLNVFLQRVFPGGKLIDTSKASAVRNVLLDFDEFTLICGLKFLWSRLPNNEIIGWNVYLEFKRREQEADYPKDAFLSIMPKCLSSSSHASIVYDFLDLLIGISSNSQYNHLSGRKVAKMASLWAFNSSALPKSAFYDATKPRENSFLDGLEAWSLTSNALFHLLLAFLRAMLPDTEAKTLSLPKTLQSLLITNSYPPPESLKSVKSVITIPCVEVKSTRRCSNPYELISKVRQALRFEKKDSFMSIENFTILKSIFQKDSTNDIVATLTEESRRVLTRLSADPVDSDYNLYPGWGVPTDTVDPDIPLFSEVTISNVTLQDYYIWTWLSSLASDQNTEKKSLFGRSLVIEAGLRGFQKWLIITETTISSDDYLKKFKYLSNPRPVDSPQLSKELPAAPGLEISDNYLMADTLHASSRDYGGDYSYDSHSEAKPTPISKDNFSDLFAQDENFAPRSHHHLRDHSPQGQQNLNALKPRPRPPPLEIHDSNTQRLDKMKLKIPKRAPNSSKSDFDRDPEPPVPPAEYEAYLAYVQAPNNGPEPYENYTAAFDKPQNRGEEPFDNYHVTDEPHYPKLDVAQPQMQLQTRVPREDRLKTSTGLSHDHGDNRQFPEDREYHLQPNAQYLPLSKQEQGNSAPQNGNGNSLALYDPRNSMDNLSLDMARNLEISRTHGIAEKAKVPDPPQDSYNYQYNGQNGSQFEDLNQPQPNQEIREGYQTVYHSNSGGYDTYGELPDPNSHHAVDADKKKKKKKKKKAREGNDLMMGPLPDGPPPALPDMTEYSNSQTSSQNWALGPNEEARANAHSQEAYPKSGNLLPQDSHLLRQDVNSHELYLQPEAPESRSKSRSKKPHRRRPQTSEEQYRAPGQPETQQHSLPDAGNASNGVAMPGYSTLPVPQHVPYSSSEHDHSLRPHGRSPVPVQGEYRSQGEQRQNGVYSPSHTQHHFQTHSGQAQAFPPQAQYAQPQYLSPNPMQQPVASAPVSHGPPHSQSLAPVLGDLVHLQTTLAPPQAMPAPQAYPQYAVPGHIPQYPPPQGYAPPPGQYYYPPPPPQQGYYPPPQGYYPQPMYYPPPGQMPMKPRLKPTASDLTMMGMPDTGKFRRSAKNKNTAQMGLRNTIKDGSFGI